MNFLMVFLLIHVSCLATNQNVGLQEVVNPYTEYESHSEDAIAHILSLNIGEFEMSIERAKNGRETVSSIAARTGADIAINAGFFHEDGSPAGVLKVNNELIGCGLKKNRGALLWEKDKILTDRIICEDDNLKSGYGTNPSKFGNIIGGVPLILFQGKSVVDNSIEKAYDSFIENRYARTAIGVSEDKLVILVVEGSSALEKKSGILKGYSIKELENTFISKQCKYAVNLDGGGSTTLVVNGKVINKIERERPVSEAIIFKRKN